MVSNSSSVFGQSSGSLSGSQSGSGQMSTQNNNSFAPEPFASSTYVSQTGSPMLDSTQSSSLLFLTPAFGASSTPAFGASTTPTFGGPFAFPPNRAFSLFGSTTPTPSSSFGISFQQSQPAFGSSSTPAFGSSSTPAFGASSTPAFGATSSPAFGTSPVPAFGASSTPAFGVGSTPAFGSSATPSFSFGSSPSFGQAQTTPMFGTGSSPFGTTSYSFGAQASPFGFQTPTQPFGSSGVGPSSFGAQHVGSRIAPYTSVPVADVHPGQTEGILESISAMPSYKDKSHEVLRREDYQLGDKGESNPADQSTSPNGPGSSSAPADPFASASAFNQTSPNPFCAPSTSSPFGASTTTFCSGSTPAFGSTTPSFSFVSPRFGQAQTPFSFGTGSSPLGRTSSPFGAQISPFRTLFAFPRSPFVSGGGSSTPAFRASSTPAFGYSTTPSFSFGSSPSTDQARTTSSPFRFPPTTQPFGRSGFGQSSFGTRRVGSRIVPYTTVPEANFDGQTTGNLQSISAIWAYKDKSHEELRLEDYHQGDKGGPNPPGHSISPFGFGSSSARFPAPNPFRFPPTSGFGSPSTTPFTFPPSTTLSSSFGSCPSHFSFPPAQGSSPPPATGLIFLNSSSTGQTSAAFGRTLQPSSSTPRSAAPATQRATGFGSGNLIQPQTGNGAFGSGMFGQERVAGVIFGPDFILAFTGVKIV